MSYKRKNKKRTPLHLKPLHNPGESLQEELDRVLYEEALPKLVMAVFIIALAVYEWIRHLYDSPPRPIPLSIIAVLVLVYTVRKIFVLRDYFKALKLGLDGEKFVGQYLEDLRSQNCRVFHDLTTESFNIDHVIVSSHGIFVVETKTYSKPMRGCPIVEYDGEKIMVNGIKAYGNPVEQARALGNWLRDFLFETTGNKYPVKSVIIFPGWFVVRKTGKNPSNVWVLNHKNFSSFMNREPESLKKEDIALIGSRIANYVRERE